MERKLTTLLSIAGSDNSAGAGIQADIKTAAYCGIYAVTALTAVTAQNSAGVADFSDIAPSLLISQLETIFRDVKPDAIKIGMAGSADNAFAIADFLSRKAGDIPIVVDPVATASAGSPLCKDHEALREAYITRLFPIATCVTPNICEAVDLLSSDIDILQASSPDMLKELSLLFLSRMGCDSVVLKGGHSTGNLLTDTLAIASADGKPETVQLSFQRIPSKNLHGTGCVYSSLLASALAKGETTERAFRFASSSIHEIIAGSVDCSLGDSSYGPLALTDYCI